MQILCIRKIKTTSHRLLLASVPVRLVRDPIFLDAHFLSNVHLKGSQGWLKGYAGMQHKENFAQLGYSDRDKTTVKLLPLHLKG